MKEERISLVDEHFSTYNTLVEKIIKIYCITCPILKLINEDLKGQLAQAISLSTTSFMSSSEKGISFEKNLQCYIRNRKSSSSKAICHYCGNKGHIRPIYDVRNVKLYNGTMAWIPKYSLTNPQGPTSCLPKFPFWLSEGTSCLYKKVTVPR